MDRLDIHLEVPAVPIVDLSSGRTAENSEQIQKRVTIARQQQTRRYRKDGLFNNAQLKPRHLKKYCEVGESGRALLEGAASSLGLSARAFGRILRVSRTISDLAGSDDISTTHLAEAIQYRTLDRPVSL